VIVLGDVSGQRTITISGGAPVVLRLGHVTDASIMSAAPIASLVALDWNVSTGVTSTVSAPSIAAMSVTAGAFNAGLTLSAGDLGVARLPVGIGGGMWSVAGGSRAIITGSVTPGWTANFGGDVGAMIINGSFAGALTARSARAVIVSGDLGGSLHLSGTLGTLSVGDAIDAADVRSGGNLNAVVAGRVIDSTIFAGVADAVAGRLPSSTAELTAASSILLLSVRGRPGLADAFAGSFVAANSIRTAIVRQIQSDNGGVHFGLAAHSLTTFVDIEPSPARPFVWRGGSQDPSLLQQHYTGDFNVIILP
jgi:hypothetical protein